MQVFDADSRSLLRQFHGHHRPVHAVEFASDRMHVLSGGDDSMVRLWDLTSGEQVGRLSGHADYVRSAAANPASNDVWATGG
jgi:U3 small nucleolar RNA-associated protein 15